MRDAVRDAASGYEAFSIKENRSKVATDVEKILSERWEKYGINVEGVDLGNIDLDKATEAAIQKVNVSRQRVETARNELDASRISAEKTKVDAQAQADADQIVRCGATVAVSEETVAGKQVRSTVIEAEMTSLRAAATKTKQVARRAEINLELQRLKSRHSAASAQL